MNASLGGLLKPWLYLKTSRCKAMSAASLRSLHGLVFDMDGTLTVPCLDFKKLRRQLGISDGVDILGHVDILPAEEKEKAMNIIDAFEKEGGENLQLQPGIHKLFRYLIDETKLKFALVTRNNTEQVENFLQKCNDLNVFSKDMDLFSVILARDFKPVKPDPASIFHIATKWSSKPENMVMVGDDIKDILCGNSAGATTILLNNDKNKETKDVADINVDCLLDIIPVVQDFLANGVTNKKNN